MRSAIAVLLAVPALSCARSPPAPALARPIPPPRVLDLAEVRGAYWGVSAIVKGHMHSCAVLEDGSVHCWGANDKGQLGFTSTEECHLVEGMEFPCTSKPTPVPGLSTVKQIVLGAAHTCALLGDGTVRCWGDDALGQLGDGPNPTKASSAMPAVVPRLDGIVAIAAGAQHSCALTHDWLVHCWGLGTDRALGGAPSTDVCFGIDSRIVCTRSPTPVPGLRGIGELMLANDTTCAFAHDGGWRCWKRDED
jgi:alpha-tubulin suppressor-like RCC1 family protein